MMVKQVNYPVVAAVPTSAVEDPATRKALSLLAQGWDVRNGNTLQRFITEQELKDPRTAAWTVSQGFAALFSGELDGVDSGWGARLAAVIDGVLHSVMASKLWQNLGEKIQFLTAQNNNSLKRIYEMQVTAGNTWEQVTGIKLQVGNNWAAWLEEKELLVSADKAQASQINTLAVSVGYAQSTADAAYGAADAANGNAAYATALIQDFKTVQANWNAASAQQYLQLQVSLGNNTTAIQQEAEARIASDGTINSRYTVKIDTNGYVSGFGLMSSANVDSRPYSDFIVRADRFAIGSPSGPGIPPAVPFTVLTTTDGAGNPPGVYMDSAFIKNASITTARIADLAVDTLKIAGNAVTIPSFYSASDTITGAGEDNPTTLAELWINMQTAGHIMAIGAAAQWYASGTKYWHIYLYIDDTMMMVIGGLSVTVAPSVSGGMYVSAGPHVVRMRWTAYDGSISITNRNLVVLGVKR
jgi:hypothetical protein